MALLVAPAETSAPGDIEYLCVPAAIDVSAFL